MNNSGLPFKSKCGTCYPSTDYQQFQQVMVKEEPENPIPLVWIAKVEAK